MNAQDLSRLAGPTVALSAAACFGACVHAQGGDTVDDATVITLVPFADTGTTEDYANDYDEVCPFDGSTAPDVVYAYTPAEDIVIDVDLCESAYDTKVYIYENEVTPGSPLACNDDACTDSMGNPYRSKLQLVELTGGNTYYFVIDGYGPESGAYDLLIDEVFVEELECPAGGTLEGEPVCFDNYDDQFNSGCGGTPPVFSPISCDETICGTGGTFQWDGLNYRDTDWYEIEIAEETTLTLSGVAEMPFLLFLIDGTAGCADMVILQSIQGQPFSVVEISAEVGPGLYWPWTATSLFDGIDCGADYIIELECGPEFECPEGASFEGEPPCLDGYDDQFNGGCGSDPPVFSPMSCGETICGTSGTYIFQGGSVRDTDWYEMTIDGPGTLELTAQADFPVLIILLDGDDGCELQTIIDSAAGGPNEPVSITAEVDGGLYWPLISTSIFSAVPCGAQYWYAATCIPDEPCPEDLSGDGVVDVTDLLALLAAWGESGVPADLDGSGMVDVADLLLLLAAWGECD